MPVPKVQSNFVFHTVRMQKDCICKNIGLWVNIKPPSALGVNNAAFLSYINNVLNPMLGKKLFWESGNYFINTFKMCIMKKVCLEFNFCTEIISFFNSIPWTF